MTLPLSYVLRIFEAATRLRLSSKAATQLNVMPGAISHHTRMLEVWFGCELFARSGPRTEVMFSGQGLVQQLAVGPQSLEHVYHALRSSSYELQLKVSSTLTTRWLLDILRHFHEAHSTSTVEISNVWMDTDPISSGRELYDCTILLGNDHFGDDTDRWLLFQERLIPVCSPVLLVQTQCDFLACRPTHSSANHRD